MKITCRMTVSQTADTNEKERLESLPFSESINIEECNSHPVTRNKDLRKRASSVRSSMHCELTG